jgi:hypothetical protein
MAPGCIKHVLERLPENQAVLKGLLGRSLIELGNFSAALNMVLDQAHQMLSDCTGETAQSSDPAPMEVIEEHQRSQLAQISDPDIESAEDAERNTLRLEWYVEKKAEEWIG